MSSKRLLYKSEDLVAVLDSESSLAFEVYRLEEDVAASAPSDSKVRATKFDRDQDCEEQYIESGQETTIEVADILRRVLKISQRVVEVDDSERVEFMVARKLTDTLKHMASVALRSGSEEEPSEDQKNEPAELGKRRPLTRQGQFGQKKSAKEVVMDESKSFASQRDGAEEGSVQHGSAEEAEDKPKKPKVRREIAHREVKAARQPREPKPPKQKKVVEYKRGKFNIRVTELDKDLAIESESPDFKSDCCDICSNRECVRAANINNVQLLKKILENKHLITTLFQEWGTDDPKTCLRVCIKNNLDAFLDVFLEEVKTKTGVPVTKFYKSPDSFAISQIDTGSNDKYAYGVATRKVALGRGNREGVNALCTDSCGESNTLWIENFNMQVDYVEEKYRDFWRFLMAHCTVSMFKKLVTALNLDFMTYFAFAVRGSNIELAAYIAEHLIKSDGYGLNQMHLKALTLQKAEEMGTFRAASVKKKSIGMNLIFPIFCAAINPHSAVFIKMYESLDDRFIRDENSSSIIFYAAKNENPEVLQYLLDNSVEYREANKQKMTCLMVAAQLGRSRNVELFMKRGDTTISKKKSRDGYAAIHYAILGNHLETVRVLLDNGADVNLAGKDRMSPIAIAACHGFYDMAKLLLERGAKVVKKDKFKRTPLIMAMKNCHARVASLLLAHGCPFDEPDSSDNYPIHYACAYGCHEGLDLLVKAGASPNVYNSWKLTPIAGAMMKNHYGIINKLLEYPDIDVNCKDDNGRTLLSNSIRILSEKTLNFVRLIITKHKADITIPDLQGRTALHHLMMTHSATFMNLNTHNIGILINVEGLKAESREKIRIFLELVGFLSGGDLKMFNVQDNSKHTALYYFFQNISAMLQFSLLAVCPSTQTYDNQKHTYVKNLTGYHQYLDGDYQLREEKYLFVRELLHLVSSYFKEASKNSSQQIHDELAQGEEKPVHVAFSELNESILRLYITGFRNYMVSKFFRSAMEFTSNTSFDQSYQELKHYRNVTKRQSQELKLVLKILINDLELSVQGKHSPPSSKSEILMFLSSRWSNLFNIPDDGKSALNIVAQQTAKPISFSTGLSGLSSARAFFQPNIGGFNSGAMINQPVSTNRLQQGFQFGTVQQPTFATFGNTQRGAPQFGGFGFGQPQTAFMGNNSAKTLKANCIDTNSTGVNDAVYAEMKEFRKLQIKEREQVTLDLLELIKKSQESTIHEDWIEQHNFCQNILSMIPNIFYLNSVATLELSTNENADYVSKSCVEMIVSNISICKKFISLAQLGVAEIKAAHIGSQNSLLMKLLDLLPSIFSNVSSYIDISQQQVDKQIVSREISSRLELVAWILDQFTIDDNQKRLVLASFANIERAPANEFERLEQAKQARVYQRSLSNTFVSLCESTFTTIGCSAIQDLRSVVVSQEVSKYSESLTSIMTSIAKAVSNELNNEGVVYNKQMLLMAVAQLAASTYTKLPSVSSVVNQEQDLTKRPASAKQIVEAIDSEVKRRLQFRDVVVDLLSQHLLAVKGIVPQNTEEVMIDYNRSCKMSDRAIEFSSLWTFISSLLNDGLKGNIDSISTILQYFDSQALAADTLKTLDDLNHKLQIDRVKITNRLLRLSLESEAFSDHKLDIFSTCIVLDCFLKAMPLIYSISHSNLSHEVKKDTSLRLITPTHLLIQLLEQIYSKCLDKSKPLSIFISSKLDKVVHDEPKQTEISFRQDLHEYLIEIKKFSLFELFSDLMKTEAFSLDNSYFVDDRFAIDDDTITAVEDIRSQFVVLLMRLSVDLFADKKFTTNAPKEAFKLPKILKQIMCQKSHPLIVSGHEVKSKNNDFKFESVVNKVDRKRKPMLTQLADYFFATFDLRKPNDENVYLPEKLFEVYLQHGWMVESQTTLKDIFQRFFRVYGDMRLEIPKLKNPLFLLAKNYYFETSPWSTKKVVDLAFLTSVMERTADPNIRYERQGINSKPESISLFDEAVAHRNPTFLLALLQHQKFDESELLSEKHKAGLHDLIEFVREPEDIAFVKAYLARVTKDELVLNHRKSGFTPLLRTLFLYRAAAKNQDSAFAKDETLIVKVVQAMINAGVSTNEAFDDAENIKLQGDKHPFSHLQNANALHMALNGHSPLPLLECLLQVGHVNPNHQRVGGNTPLHDLIEKKKYHEPAIRLFLTHKADPNIVDNNQESAVFEAVRRDNLALVDLLVQYGATLNLNNYEDMSPLVIMIKNKNIPGIEHLIAIGSDVNFADRYGRNSLHWAINFADHTANSSFEIEDILIKAGVEINKKDLLGRTPLHYPFVKVGSVTIDHMVDPIESVNSLLAKKNLKVDEPDIFGNTPMLYAAQRGSLVSALYLIDRDANMDAINLEGNSVLAVAMIAGHDHLAITMLNKGAKWNSKVKIYTPEKREKVYNAVMSAVVQKILQVDQVKSSVLEGLHQHDAEAEKKSPGYNKVTDVHTFRLAINKNWQGMAYMILSRGYDIGEAVFATIQEKKFNYTFTLLTKSEDNRPYLITDSKGDNLAHLTCYAASEVKRDLLEKIFRVLVRKGISLQSPNILGHNALHCAAVCGSTPMIQLLLEQKIDPNVKDEAGRTPMMLAAQNHNKDALVLLFDHTKDKNEQDTHGRNILHYLCQMPNISDVDLKSLLERICKSVDANEADSHGKMPIDYLLKTTTAVESQLFLLEITKNINLRDSKGQSTIMIALKHAPTLQIISTLLDRGAKLNGPDHVGRTAIGNLLALSHYSDSKKLEALETILRIAEVDFNELTSFKVGIELDTKLPLYEKMTPLDFLFRSPNPNFDVIKMLLQNGAKADQPNDANMKSLEILLTHGKKLNVISLLVDSEIYRLPISCDFEIVSINPFYAKQQRKVPGLCRLIEEKIDPNFIQILVARGSNDINKIDSNRISPFIYAVSEREFTYIGPLIAGQLASKGKLALDIMIPEKMCLFDYHPELTTPLCCSLTNYQPQIANLLIANGASPNFTADPARPPGYYLLRDCHSRELFVPFLRLFLQPNEFNVRCAGSTPLKKINFNFTIELLHKISDDKTESIMVSPLFYAVAKRMPIDYLEELLTHFPALDYLHPITKQSAFSLALETNVQVAKCILRAATLNSPYCLMRKRALHHEDTRTESQKHLPLNTPYIKAFSKADEAVEQVLPLNQLYSTNVKSHHILRAITHGADFNLQDGPKNTNLVMMAIYRNDLPLLVEIERLVNARQCVQFDASKTDIHGRTPIHAVVNSHKNGSFENVEMLRLLALHYDVNKSDNNGFPPYYYAAQQDSGVMLEALIELGAREFEMPFGLRRAPTSLISFAVFPTNVPNYDEDAEMYLAAREAAIKAETASKPKTIALDQCVPSNIAATSVVEIDEHGKPMDVYLTKVDIKKGQFGGNVFYRMQLLHETNRDVYVVVTRYGRIGDSGQNQLTSFAKKEEAVHEFCSIFKSKSGNDWKDADNFQRVKKKYKLARYNSTSAKEELQDFYEKTHEKDLPESLLSENVRIILKEVANSKVLFARVKTLNVDTSKLPLSRLNKADLMQAMTLLQEMKKTAKELTEERAVDVVDSDPEKIFELLDELSDMTSEYFELIPSNRYRNSSIPPMEDIGSIDQNIMVVRQLLEVEVAVKILLGARLKIKEVHPLDYCYNSLNIKMLELDDQSVERSAILEYIRKSKEYGHPDSVKVFALERKGETERFSKYLKMKNRKLLWHGSRTMNFLGVLNRGLKIAPPEAPTTGHMFGKGIYFSDTFSKSLNYCEGNVNIVLLCEVALGNTEKLYSSRNTNQPTAGYDSVMGLGQNTPDPNQDIVIPNGMVIPLGPLVKRHNPDNLVTLNCNEFVVYNEDQVKIRYMVALGLPLK